MTSRDVLQGLVDRLHRSGALSVPPEDLRDAIDATLAGSPSGVISLQLEPGEAGDLLTAASVGAEHAYVDQQRLAGVLSRLRVTIDSKEVQ
jgi:hypothetical protein